MLDYGMADNDYYFLFCIIDSSKRYGGINVDALISPLVCRFTFPLLDAVFILEVFKKFYNSM